MKRFDKKYVYYSLFTDFFISLILAFYIGAEALLVEDEMGEVVGFDPTAVPFIIGIFVIAYIVMTVYRLLYYRLSGYELSEREIVCLRGVLFRKRSIIEYARIHAINKKQNIFHKLFGIAVLTVDSGSANTGHKAELIIIERDEVVDSMLKELHLLREGGVRDTSEEDVARTLIDESDPLYSFTSKKKMLYSLISIVSSAFVTAVIAIIAIFMIGILNAILKLDIFGTLTEFMLGALIAFFTLTLAIAFLSFIATIIVSFVKYYNFKIERIGSDIKISYGLLERHENTFSYDRIRAVKITQGLVQRMLGFATINLEVIGYVEENGNNAEMIGVLVPFCKYSEINEILGRILPDYVPTERQTSSPAFFPYVSWFSLILGVCAASVYLMALIPMLILEAPGRVILALTLSTISSIIVIMGIKLVSACLEYKTSGVGIDGKMITIYSGGFIQSITVMRASALSSVESVTTYHRAMRGISSAVLHLRTNATTNEVKLHLQESNVTDKLNKLMKY